MYKRVTKRNCAIARRRADAIVRDVQVLLKNKYIFSPRIVGSRAWGTMIEDENGEYDLDYQLLLTKNSPSYDKANKKFPSPTQIKIDFLKAFNKAKKENENFQDSTTAITLINKDKKPYHIDFVIIKTFPENNYIIRRNNKGETQHKNEFTWNELPYWNEAYRYFKSLSPKEKQYLVEKVYTQPSKIKKRLRIFIAQKVMPQNAMMANRLSINKSHNIAK